ncbi:Xaa-Pro aminopeptidase 2 [Desmophyllum pertusum]|uniref:Xaa-Pro aminopeptidase 2 n=1 Tax=Desmophyllum pertusum TaxID=174260 RepID=A0A9W9YB89_9CNID|nr:Xaa-Pro aminopeptidase 2 [Desmophyllum pertusum]
MDSRSLGCLVFVFLSSSFLVHCKVFGAEGEEAPSLPKVNTTERLKELRQKMQQEGVQAYIIPSVDQHMSEYVAPHFRRRQYISGFTGSNGDAVITMDKAAMWTDGRYFLQATMQMDGNWILMRLGEKGTPKQAEWLAKELTSGDKVGVDVTLISIADYEDMSKELQKPNIALKSVSENLVDAIWTNGRPPLGNATIYPLGIKFTGKTWQDKIKDLRDEMSSNNATAVIVYELDEVAWLLNLRGADVPSNPFFFAFIVVYKNDINVYIDESKLTSDAKSHLTADINLLPYNTSKLIADIKAEGVKNDAKIWLSPFSSYALKEAIPQDKLLPKDSPIALPKSIKNPTEIKGMKNANLKDNTAMLEFFFWLKNEVPKGSKDLTEMSSVKKLEEFKSEQDDYMGYSFETIAGFGPNGAIIHYRPEESTNLQVTDNSTFLVDSGSQFKDGTTDTTRTVHFGTPTAHEKDAYTRVLKGQISLALAVFPNKIQGRFLDTIARKEMWGNGLDYRHGTGHGIGMFLSVHEGPQRIAPGCPKPWERPIVPGMFQSDEPGYYEDGVFGIRLETVVMAVPAKTDNTFNNVQYVTFEAVSFVPYWKPLIDFDIMTPIEIDWLEQVSQGMPSEDWRDVKKKGGKDDVYDWLVEFN